MRNCLTIILNILFEKELTLLYGKNTLVEINYVKYCTTNKNYLIDSTLKISDIKLYEEVGSGGLEHLIDEGWKYMGMSEVKKIIIISTDIID